MEIIFCFDLLLNFYRNGFGLVVFFEYLDFRGILIWNLIFLSEYIILFFIYNYNGEKWRKYLLSYV